MIEIELGPVLVPSLGFGTWLLDGAECEASVESALDLGYRHVDTAQIYQNETEVGRAIAASSVPRDEIFLTTKVWREHLDPRRVVSSTEASLRRLATDHVDLLLVHWPNHDADLGAALDALVTLQTRGLTRLIGVSNFPSELFRWAAVRAPIVCNQVEYHPFLGQSEVLTAARDHEAMVTAYSPIARGRVGDDPALQRIATAHGRTPAQIALRWLIQQEGVAAVPKSATLDHRRDNLAIFDFELSPDEMAQVGGLARGQRLVDPPWSPDWDDDLTV